MSSAVAIAAIVLAAAFLVGARRLARGLQARARDRRRAEVFDAAQKCNAVLGMQSLSVEER